MSGAEHLVDRPAAYAGPMGFGRRDITPPPGIHSAIWGASTHAQPTGTHRPLLATALVLGDPLLVLVGIDHMEPGDLRIEGRTLAENVAHDLELDPARLIVAYSHAHSVPWLTASRLERTGGDLIPVYAQQMREGIVAAVRDAIAAVEPATLTWWTGKCDLAANRDLPDPASTDGRYLCGFNPATATDDTLLVGRVTRDADGRIIGTIVNYACHPVALGPGNTLVSPDYVGAMRELVERDTGDAPCLFLQGASGDTQPALQYADDPEIADRHGRRLGHSVMATLEAMYEPGHELAFDHVLESGAPLAMWELRRFTPDTTTCASMIEVAYQLKDERPREDVLTDAESATEAYARERLTRKAGILDNLVTDDEGRAPVPAWVWRIGPAIVVGHPNEAYSDFQVELRQRLGDPVVVMNVVNSGVVAYLPPSEFFDSGEDIYALWQSPYARGSLELLTDAVCETALGLRESE